MFTEDNYIPWCGAIVTFDETYLIKYLQTILPDSKWDSDTIVSGFEEIFESLGIKTNIDIQLFKKDVFVYSKECDQWCFAINQMDYNENVSPKSLKLILFNVLTTIDLLLNNPKDFDKILYSINILDLEKI